MRNFLKVGIIMGSFLVLCFPIYADSPKDCPSYCANGEKDLINNQGWEADKAKDWKSACMARCHGDEEKAQEYLKKSR